MKNQESITEACPKVEAVASPAYQVGQEFMAEGCPNSAHMVIAEIRDNGFLARRMVNDKPEEWFMKWETLFKSRWVPLI